MKNLFLLTIIIISLLSSTASFAGGNPFYLKGEIGANSMGDLKLKNKKLKQDKAVFFGGGVGYYVLDNLRLDLILNFLPNNTAKNSSKTENTEIKTKITSLTLNGYVDILDISICDFFIGGGVGVDQLNNTITRHLNSNKDKSDTLVNNTKKYNLIYHVTIGSAVKLADGIKVEAAYSWKDFGSTKEIKHHIKSLSYKGHNISLGIRIDI